MKPIKRSRLLQLMNKDNFGYLSYLAVAKMRAKALSTVARLVPMQRPQLFIGTESCYELCDLIINSGATNVLIVTDSVLNQLKLPAKVTHYLKDHNIEYHVYDGITPDPTFDVVEIGLNQSIAAGCNAVIAMGGGSVIDAAKMIAMSQGNDCPPKALIGLFKAKKPLLPFYCIPTTAGTGSEATIGAVISNDLTHQKELSIDPKMISLASAIDPTIMQGMPPRITAETGIDTLTHALEAWMSVNATVETDFYAASAANTVMKNLPIAYKDGDNLKAREEMGIAAHYGGIALNKAGLGYVHAIAHQLGAYYKIPHGRANAIVLPYILELNRHACKQRLAMLTRKIGVLKTADVNSSDSQLTDLMIDRVKNLINLVGINPVIKGMQQSDFTNIAHAAAQEVRDTYAVPIYIRIDAIEAILAKIKTASDAIDNP